MCISSQARLLTKTFLFFFLIDLRPCQTRPPPTPRQPSASARQHPAQARRRAALAPTATVPMVRKPVAFLFQERYNICIVCSYCFFRKKKQHRSLRSKARPLCQTSTPQIVESSSSSSAKTPTRRGGETLLHADGCAAQPCLFASGCNHLSLAFAISRALVLILKMQPSREKERGGAVSLPSCSGTSRNTVKGQNQKCHVDESRRLEATTTPPMRHQPR